MKILLLLCELLDPQAPQPPLSSHNLVQPPQFYHQPILNGQPQLQSSTSSAPSTAVSSSSSSRTQSINQTNGGIMLYPVTATSSSTSSSAENHTTNGISSSKKNIKFLKCFQFQFILFIFSKTIQ